MIKSKKIKVFLGKYKAILIVIPLVAIVLLSIHKSRAQTPLYTQQKTPFIWQIRSIDTMKTSRDKARDKLSHPEFDLEIQQELTAIKNTGANYVAVDTPYDDEFLPYLKRWVTLARQTGLHVWFRGNWSNWEGWFDYPKNMTPDGHIQKNTEFIAAHPDLFQDGDIFDPCPECENAGFWPQTEKNQEYRNFIKKQQKSTQEAFKKIRKNVYTHASIIGGRAKDVLDQDTFDALNNIIAIDHYFKNSQSITDYIEYFSKSFHTKILVSEFGAPIPDINGSMTEKEQAAFINQVFEILYGQSKSVVGINYYVLNAGTTELLNTDGTPRLAYSIVKNYFSPAMVTGTVTNTLGDRVGDVPIQAKDGSNSIKTDNQGGFIFLIPPPRTVSILIGGDTYNAIGSTFTVHTNGEKITKNFVVTPSHPSLLYKLRLFWKQFRK